MSTTIAAPAVSLVDVPSAAVALTQGKITKEQFIQFASSHAADSALVLRMMVDGVLSVAETSKIIDSQQAIAATPARQPGALHFKVSEKGALSRCTDSSGCPSRSTANSGSGSLPTASRSKRSPRRTRPS